MDTWAEEMRTGDSALVHDFFSQMQHLQLFDHKVGHVWKLERNETRGYYFHLALFLNGQEPVDEYLGLKILNCWEAITKGGGELQWGTKV